MAEIAEKYWRKMMKFCHKNKVSCSAQYDFSPKKMSCIDAINQVTKEKVAKSHTE